MTNPMRIALAALVVAALGFAVIVIPRVMRVKRATAAMPVYPGSREAGGRTRYFPRLLSWYDRSSARVQRIFAVSPPVSLATIARYADSSLTANGWYLSMPEALGAVEDPQVIVWQREPDERLDLTKLWPMPGLTREQRLYGDVFPPEFLDESLVIEWSWALGGPRSPRPATPRPGVRHGERLR